MDKLETLCCSIFGSSLSMSDFLAKRKTKPTCSEDGAADQFPVSLELASRLISHHRIMYD